MLRKVSPKRLYPLAMCSGLWKPQVPLTGRSLCGDLRVPMAGCICSRWLGILLALQTLTYPLLTESVYMCMCSRVRTSVCVWGVGGWRYVRVCMHMEVRD